MAARTDADRRKRGRVPAIGDWYDGVHRGVARAYLQTQAQNQDGRSGGGAGAIGAGVEISKRSSLLVVFTTTTTSYYCACGCARQIRRSGTDTPSTSLHHDSAHIVIERTSASRLTGRCS